MLAEKTEEQVAASLIGHQKIDAEIYVLAVKNFAQIDRDYQRILFTSFDVPPGTEVREGTRLHTASLKIGDIFSLWAKKAYYQKRIEASAKEIEETIKSERLEKYLDKMRERFRELVEKSRGN